MKSEIFEMQGAMLLAGSRNLTHDRSAYDATGQRVGNDKK
jgi:hypothetical protein